MGTDTEQHHSVRMEESTKGWTADSVQYDARGDGVFLRFCDDTDAGWKNLETEERDTDG